MSSVALHNNKIVGAVLGSWDGRRGWLHHLAVQKGYRRQGIASMLITKAMVKMKHKKISLVKVEIYSENKASRALFSKMGFRQYKKLLTYGKEL
jgi:ribosomal protein S18 acetylase RimI-like enzyme